MDEGLARDAYYALGVDLIRTAGLLVRTTPSVIYRAAVLLQRFEASVDAHFRARYMSAADTAAYRRALDENMARAQRRTLLSASSSSPQGSPLMLESTRDSLETPCPTAAEYLVPRHAGQTMRSGLVALVDLRAPLDYCLHHVIDQEDIVYLSAACLLIATKMEDPGVRIRAVVNACMRISERRAGLVVNETQKPPTARYEDFKACVVDAEEVVLHQLGFQTFVEAPYKYVLLYLNMLVQPTDVSAEEIAARRPSPALTQWMVKAVQLVNDFPRCRQLLQTPSDVLALYAMQQTRPADLQLPDNWVSAFGVHSDTLTTVDQVYGDYLKSAVGSRRAADVLADVRAQLTVAAYRTVSESADYAAAMQLLQERRRHGAGGGGSGVSQSASPAPPLSHELTPATYNAAFLSSAGPLPAASLEELRDIISAPFPPQLPSAPPLSGGRRERDEQLGLDQAAKRDRRER